MTFDLVVQLACSFMTGAKQKEMFEISDLRRREILHLRSVSLFIPKWVGGGFSDIFKNTYALAIFGGFSDDFVDIFFWGGGSSQNWTIFRGNFYAF